MFKGSNNTSGYGNIGRTTNNIQTSNIANSLGLSGHQGQKQNNTAATSHYAGYEAAVYAAASSYLQAKNTGQSNQWMSNNNNKRLVGGNTSNNKFGGKFQGLLIKKFLFNFLLF